MPAVLFLRVQNSTKRGPERGTGRRAKLLSNNEEILHERYYKMLKE
jgi:hypothetical protein